MLHALHPLNAVRQSQEKSKLSDAHLLQSQTSNHENLQQSSPKLHLSHDQSRFLIPPSVRTHYPRYSVSHSSTSRPTLSHMIKHACAPSGTTQRHHEGEPLITISKTATLSLHAWSDSCRRRQTGSSVALSQRVPCRGASGLCGARRRSLFAPRMKGQYGVLSLHTCSRASKMTRHVTSYPATPCHFAEFSPLTARGGECDACSMHVIT